MQLDLQRSARRRGTSRRFSPRQEKCGRRRRRLVNMTPPLLHLPREGILFRLRRRNPAPFRRRRRLRSNGVLRNRAVALLIPSPRQWVTSLIILVHLGGFNFKQFWEFFLIGIKRRMTKYWGEKKLGFYLLLTM